MFTIQVDGEIELGLLEERHAQPMLDLNEQSRDYLREWLPVFGNLMTLEDNLNVIKEGMKRFVENNGFYAGIWYKGELAGIFICKYYDWKAKQTEFGYLLGKTYTGKGIVTRATRKMTDYAFKELGLNRIEIRCGTGNTSSRAVAERLGYVHEGILRQSFRLYDQFIDTALYSMLASDWESQK